MGIGAERSCEQEGPEHGEPGGFAGAARDGASGNAPCAASRSSPTDPASTLDVAPPT